MAKSTMKRGCSQRFRDFGKALHALLYLKPGIMDILPGGSDTWIAGGCGVLGHALHEWLGPRSSMWAMFDARGYTIQHLVVRVRNCYFDGDGAASKAELLKLWREDEGLYKPYLRRFQTEEIGAIECPFDSIRDLFNALEEEFGSADELLDWMLK